MSIKKISRQKQIHLALVAAVTVGVIAALWIFVIGAQKAHIRESARLCEGVEAEKGKERRIIKGAGVLMEELQAATNHLGAIEGSMPSGDLYSWIVGAIKQFNVPSYHVVINQVGSPDVADMRLIPGFPYTQVTVNVNGSAHYQELGKFIADLENQFPQLRIQNLSLDPSHSQLPQEHESLFFHMEVISLVKPIPALVAAQ